MCVSLDFPTFVIVPDIKATEVDVKAENLTSVAFISGYRNDRNWGAPKKHTVPKYMVIITFKRKKKNPFSAEYTHPIKGFFLWGCYFRTKIVYTYLPSLS